ncbi:MAG: polysaccharide deacetylase family protein [Candidatus Firestonebacteria bacterium]
MARKFLYIALFLYLLFTKQVFADGVAILCYHRIVESPKSTFDISLKQFEEQINYLISNKFKFLSLNDVVKVLKEDIPPNSVSITIDDGDISVYTVVLPILKKHNIPATIFVYTDYIANGGRTLKWEQLKEIYNSGIEIGSHTKSHPKLTKIKETQLKIELANSKKILEKKLGIQIKYLAYPYGLYNETVEKTAIQCGYNVMFTIDFGINNKGQNIYRLKRKLVLRDMSLPQFKNLLH